MHFVTFFATITVYSIAVVLSTPLVSRDVPTVEADIANISSQINTLDSSINAFPSTGGTLQEALNIHTDATNLDSAIKKATTDTDATSPFDAADEQSIITAVTGFQPNIISALKEIAAKKSAFEALPIGGIPALVLQDLETLNTDTTAFEKALILDAPASLQTQAASITSAINAAFATAIAAYQ